MVAGRGIVRNYGRNNNSPATGNRWEHRSTAVLFTPQTTIVYKTLREAVSVPNGPERGLMYQLLFVGSLVAILVALLVVRQKRASKRRTRWMPDIRRVA